jgi:hypothetical protein
MTVFRRWQRIISTTSFPTLAPLLAASSVGGEKSDCGFKTIISVSKIYLCAFLDEFVRGSSSPVW